jgi:hypothetical protein
LLLVQGTISRGEIYGEISDEVYGATDYDEV